jgi:hypothetical protein
VGIEWPQHGIVLGIIGAPYSRGGGGYALIHETGIDRKSCTCDTLKFPCVCLGLTCKVNKFDSNRPFCTAIGTT